MKHFISIVILLFCVSFSKGQNNTQKYFKYINKAELAICDFKYEKASQYYEKAFHAITPFCNDLFNATILNVKFTKKYDLALNYSRQLLQKDFEIGWVYRLIDSKDSLIALKFKSLEDTVKSQTNKNLKLILEEMLEKDQKEATTPQEKYEKCLVHHTNFIKLFELTKEYGTLTEQIVGIYEYSPIHIILVHAAQAQMSPQELLLQDVLNGKIYAENYIKYYDLYLENIGKPTRFGYGWNPIFISNDILFIVHPDNINKTNNERNKINIAETWEDYVKKAKYQFLNNNFQLFTRVNVMQDEEEVTKMMQEIDEEHQKGIYKREYVIREKK